MASLPVQAPGDSAGAQIKAAAAASSPSATTNVVNVTKAAPLPRLAPPIAAIEQMKGAVTSFFTEADAELQTVQDLFDRLTVTVNQKAVSRLPAKLQRSQEADDLKKQADALKTFGEGLKAKYDAFVKVTDSATKTRLKGELIAAFLPAKQTYATASGSAKTLLEKCVADWKAWKKEHAHKTLQITITEANAFKDKAVASKVNSEVIDAHRQITEHNDGVFSNLKADREALLTYLELTAMVICWIAPYAVVEGAEVAVGAVRTTINYMGSLFQKAPTYNEHAPDPWNGTGPPNYI
jgi:hypothetical protein